MIDVDNIAGAVAKYFQEQVNNDGLNFTCYDLVQICHLQNLVMTIELNIHV